MKTLDKDMLNSKAVKVFIKGLLMLVGLFGFLSYGIVALLLCSGIELDCKIFVFIIIFPILPIVILSIWFLLFSRYAESCNEKINKALANKNNEILLEEQRNREILIKKQITEVMGEAYLIVTKAIKPDSEKNIEALQKLLKEMPAMFSKMSLEENPKLPLISDSSNGGNG